MKSTKTVVLDHLRIQRITDRFAHQIMEDFHEEKIIILVGIKGRGMILAKRIANILGLESKFKIIIAEIKLNKDQPLNHPITLSIDADEMKNRVVVLIDDVLNSGRTLIHSLSHLLKTDVKRIATIVLIDRTHRKFPVKADYSGLTLSTNLREHVSVELSKKDVVYLS